MIDWATMFEEAYPKPAASAAEIERFITSVGRPLSKREVDEVIRFQRNPWTPSMNPVEHAAWKPFDPTPWRMPARPIPESYLSFLRWSDGGQFSNGKRLFQMYGTGLRQMMIDRNIPEYMPDALPFAFNGGGIMYMFDIREAARAREYPIICAAAGNFGWAPGRFAPVADDFPEACRGRTDVMGALTSAFMQALGRAEP